MILKSSVMFMCMLVLGCAKIQQDPTRPTSQVTYHHLKWITNKTKFPVEMSVPIPVEHQQTEASSASFWDWLRLNDNKWMSKMKELMKNFLVMETRDRATFMVLNYNNHTHEQLGSYEPRVVRSTGGKMENNERSIELENGATSSKRDIFTLAYLKDHYIKTEKFPDRIKVTCYADFLVANTTMIDTVMSLMERYASFKMAVKSAQANWAGPAPGPRYASHTRNHVRPFESRRPSSQEQQQEQHQHQQQWQQQLLQQQQLQELQRLQHHEQFKQQLLQIQQQWRQSQQAKQMHQQQQQQQPQQKQAQPELSGISIQSLIEKLVDYRQPPRELLERERLMQQQQKDMVLMQQQQQQQQQPTIQIVQQAQQPQQQQQVVQPQVFRPAEKDGQQQQNTKVSKDDEPQREQIQQSQQSQQPVEVSQQIQQQQQQQQPQPKIQDHISVQYPQLYHPVHHPAVMIPMASYPSTAATFHPAVYQNDLVNFYASLFTPNQPHQVAYSSSNLYAQQTQQQSKEQQQQSAESSMQAQSPQVVTTSLPLQQSQLYPGIAYVMPQSPYEYYFNPRLGKREVRSSMVGSEQTEGRYDYEHDYDESRFLKIRLSLGPISIYRPFDKEEAVSCSLNLINIDTLLSEYQNRILEIIDTSEYNTQKSSEAEESDDYNNDDEKNGQQQQEHNDLMFMIDGKNVDPSAEIKMHKTPKQQEEMMNKVRDKSVAELIEMERQMNIVKSTASRISFSSITTAVICVFIALFI